MSTRIFHLCIYFLITIIFSYFFVIVSIDYFSYGVVTEFQLENLKSTANLSICFPISKITKGSYNVSSNGDIQTRSQIEIFKNTIDLTLLIANYPQIQYQFLHYGYKCALCNKGDCSTNPDHKLSDLDFKVQFYLHEQYRFP